MAAEMIIDMTKTFSGRAPIHARLRYEVEASTVLILLPVRVRQNDHSPVRCGA